MYTQPECAIMDPRHGRPGNVSDLSRAATVRHGRPDTETEASSGPPQPPFQITESQSIPTRTTSDSAPRAKLIQNTPMSTGDVVITLAANPDFRNQICQIPETQGQIQPGPETEQEYPGTRVGIPDAIPGLVLLLLLTAVALLVSRRAQVLSY
eukprot:2337865-Rhodomonas_salina.2